MTPRFVMVNVDEHDAIPEGCCLRFKIASEPRPVRRVLYEPEGASSSVACLIEVPGEGAAGGGGHDGSVDAHAEIAWAAEVEDSGAGTSTLVYGGSRGLRLRPVGGGPSAAEPYLLIAREAVLEWG